jgi:hypothetical protein
MSTCSIYKRQYLPFPETEDEGGTHKTISEWVGLTSGGGMWRLAEFNYKTGFKFMVGSGPLGPDNVYTIAPFIYRYITLGSLIDILSKSNPANYFWYNPCLYRAIFRGATYCDPILVDSPGEVLIGNIPGGPNVYHTSPCCP